LLGYIRGYDNAADFRALGTKSWDANANENAAWLANPHRKGTDDMGLVYGAVGRNFPKPDGGSVDLLRQIVDDLKKGVDNRGEIYTFYHPKKYAISYFFIIFEERKNRQLLTNKTLYYYGTD